jgi:hydrogenase assembly chaperone HypC/HupF
VLSFTPLLAAFADRPPDARRGAELLHGTLVEGLAELAVGGLAETGLSTICLGGGCMINRVLAEGLVNALSVRGLTPILARRLPPNDGGLSLGQAVMVRRRSTKGNETMCLAIPALITEMLPDRMARISLDGVTKTISVALVEDVTPGDYVIVHVGHALSKIDPEEAARTLALLAEYAALAEPAG